MGRAPIRCQQPGGCQFCRDLLLNRSQANDDRASTPSDAGVYIAAMMQSAAIPYRLNHGGELKVLLVTSRKRRRRVLPKGNVPIGMAPHRSATCEALEEAGLFGTIKRTASAPMRRARQHETDSGARSSSEPSRCTWPAGCRAGPRHTSAIASGCRLGKRLKR